MTQMRNRRPFSLGNLSQILIRFCTDLFAVEGESDHVAHH